MKFRIIEAQCEIFPVGVLCDVMTASKAGYIMLGAADRKARERRPIALCSPRSGASIWHIADAMAGLEHTVSRGRVERLMRREGIRAVTPQRFRACTTDSRHDWPIAPNRLAQKFAAERPNQVWLADISYVPTSKGWLYLAVVLDLFSREIVGWVMHGHMREELTITALTMTIQRQKPPSGLIHHSGRGSQYAAAGYRKVLDAAGMIQSMSRTENCWDNAPMESCFGTIKTGLVHQACYPTRATARHDLFAYIEVYYNRQRLHSALGYITPEQAERQAA
jgi:putative transposase